MIYNIISQQKITSPFVQIFNEQEFIIKELNYLFKQCANATNNFVISSENINDINLFIDGNMIIFNNENLILFNFVELKLSNQNEMVIKFLHPANHKYLFIVDCIYRKYNEFLKILQKWNITFEKYNGVIHSTPINFIQILKKDIMMGTLDKPNYLILPYNEHLKKYLTKLFTSLDKDVNNLSFLISFESTELSNFFSYKIFMYANDKSYLESLDENKLVLIHEDEKRKSDIDVFLKYLFIYGKI